MKSMARIKIAGVGVLLLITALHHSSGYPQIGSQLASSSLPTELAVALGGLWLFFSWHLLVMAVVAFFAAASGAGWLRPVLLFCGVVTLGDFLWVLRVAGWFLGTALLLLAGLGLLVGGYMWRRD